MNHRKPMLYIAGPLFTEAERDFNKMLRGILSQFFDVFLPQEAGMIGELVRHGIDPSESSRHIYDACMAELNKCDAFLIVLDGAMTDDGAAFELGIAHARKVPRFGLLTDNRKDPAPTSVNLMLYYSLDEIFTGLNELAEWGASFAAGQGRNE